MPPIVVTGLFRELNDRLVELLRSLDADDWHRPTVSSERRVKDIVSHLLDGSFRRLSLQRDHYAWNDAPQSFSGHDDLMQYLHRLNSDWTTATRRLSPRILTELLEQTGPELEALFASLDPIAPAVFPVGWAGEFESQNWFDIAREYTEKWHHTQQIFDAVNRESTIEERRLFNPCLATFMTALPHSYRDINPMEGTVVAVIIRGEAGGQWTIQRQRCTWTFSEHFEPDATFAIDQDSAWRLFTKRMPPEVARTRFPDIEITGDVALGEVALGMISVMA